MAWWTARLDGVDPKTNDCEADRSHVSRLGRSATAIAAGGSIPVHPAGSRLNIAWADQECPVGKWPARQAECFRSNLFELFLKPFDLR